MRGGLEMRQCSPEGGFCFYVGVEAGYQEQTWSDGDEMPEHHDGAIYGARFGLDVGGEQVRFRAGVDAYKYRRTSDVMALDDETTGGLGLGLALVYRL